MANPRLSMRSIAKKVNISSGRFSEILNEKRILSDHYLEKIVQGLSLSESEIIVLRQIQLEQQSKNYIPIDASFNWKSFAVMSFIKTSTYSKITQKYPSNELQQLEIAKLMKLDLSEVCLVIDNLTKLDQIHWVGDRWSLNSENTAFRFDTPNESNIRTHSQNLKLAESRLHSTDLCQREFSSIAIAIDPSSDMNRLKRMIRIFRKNFALAADGDLKSAVYCLSIQFYPVVDSEPS